LGNRLEDHLCCCSSKVPKPHTFSGFQYAATLSPYRGSCSAAFTTTKDVVLTKQKMLVVASAMFVSCGSLVASEAEARSRHLNAPPLSDGTSGQRGLATWYGPGFHGRKTASGERFNTHAFTAAHRSLPFGTHVAVLNEATGRSVVVRINDRGPHRRGAVIDLSRASAAAIGISGVARVRLVSLGS
jgi:rare lipoprotein A